jgi:putative NADPH-quinone reductase
MKKVVVILAHPNLKTGSVSNACIINEIQGVPGVEVRDLMQMYPDFKIDVEAEQAALQSADIVIYQFPLYWFSSPAILKEWHDQVFTYGFAFGSTGGKLAGKELLLSVTVGGGEKNYDGAIKVILTPFEQTAKFCGLNYNDPLCVYGIMSMPGDDSGLESVLSSSKEHAASLIEFIKTKQSC